MNIISKIPGFRSENLTKSIIAVIYYSFFIGTTLGSANLKMAFLYGSFIFVPFVVMYIKDRAIKIKNNEFKLNKIDLIYGVLSISIVYSLNINSNNTIVPKLKLKNYKNLSQNIEKLKEEDSKYHDDNEKLISDYLSLKSKYEDISAQFEKYKTEHPQSIKEQVDASKEDVNKYYGIAVGLENKIKEAKKEKHESQIANSNNSSYSSSNSSTSGSSGNNSSNKHIGRKVYVANGNSYYHAISNCKYLEGASTSLVTLTSSMRKYECNCWTNPIVYKPSSNSSISSSGGSSSGRTVYIASGNSYYHNSPSCKFIRGASVKAVGINNVGGKHACNCVKY